MQIPSDYAVLFMHGGATNQFSMLPLNFLKTGESADYIVTGHWSAKASAEARKFARVNEVNALRDHKLLSILPAERWRLNANAIYVHYCDNETISGVAFKQVPDVRDKPLLCDMTSSILTRPIEIRKYALIYASTQKNLGIAGLCVVIISKALLSRTCRNVPRLHHYKRYAEDNSLVNTPPVFAIYVLRLVLSWCKNAGGIDQMYKWSKQRSAAVYQTIDASQLYNNRVAQEYRSRLNIPFQINRPDLQNHFLRQAGVRKLLGLRGHNSVGGMRASLYNATPRVGVRQLVKFMREFASANT